MHRATSQNRETVTIVDRKGRELFKEALDPNLLITDLKTLIYEKST
jgi:hypothetical protein